MCNDFRRRDTDLGRWLDALDYTASQKAVPANF